MNAGDAFDGDPEIFRNDSDLLPLPMDGNLTVNAIFKCRFPLIPARKSRGTVDDDGVFRLRVRIPVFTVQTDQNEFPEAFSVDLTIF